MLDNASITLYHVAVMQSTSTFKRYQEALTALGIRRYEVAELCDIHVSRISLLINGHLDDTPTVTAQKRSICRDGLMVKAVLLGLPDDEVWRYGEHAIFGMPEPDRDVVMPQVRTAARRATEVREGRSA